MFKVSETNNWSGIGFTKQLKCMLLNTRHVYVVFLNDTTSFVLKVFKFKFFISHNNQSYWNELTTSLAFIYGTSVTHFSPCIFFPFFSRTRISCTTKINQFRNWRCQLFGNVVFLSSTTYSFAAAFSYQQSVGRILVKYWISLHRKVRPETTENVHLLPLANASL